MTRARSDNDDWRTRAACRTARPADFSPVDTRGRVDLNAARLVAAHNCGPCPVRDACLGEAMTAGRTPQELVQGGLWFPIATAEDTRPVDLLATIPAVAGRADDLDNGVAA